VIISASRRTDIPAFYSDWFLDKIQQGYVMVRNRVNYHQVSKVSLTPEVVDCIVFWTKNPAPMLDKLDSLRKYPFYFQFTLTPYNGAVETHIACKEAIIDSFVALSKKVGKRRVIWRYDPIFLTDYMDLNYHLKAFEFLIRQLGDYTDKCVISFIDYYKHIKKNFESLRIKSLPENIIREVAHGFADVAHSHGLTIESCAEDIDLSGLGINHGKCIDDKLISEIIGTDIIAEKDGTQRKSCGCVASIDIGSYNTCDHRCLYCYANFSRKMVEKHMAEHDPASPLLTGRICGDDTITERKAASCKIAQDCLFPLR
jgi:hypothetical protein